MKNKYNTDVNVKKDLLMLMAKYEFDIENTRFSLDKDKNPIRMYEVGKYYKIQRPDGIKHIKYVGVFNNINEVPFEVCLYCIDNCLYVREINYDKLIKSNFFNEGMNKRAAIKIDKDDTPLQCDPSENDNILLILLKLVMKHRNLTENGFKKLFTNASEMNNMKRLIFHGNGVLSWPKFNTMIESLGADINIRIIDKESPNKEIIASNEDV